MLFLANLEVRKGIHVLLDAFAQLVTQLPDARLLVGRRWAPSSTRCAAVSGRSPSLDRVELLGHVERDRVDGDHAELRRLLPALVWGPVSG